jgi:hypothetical protein
MTMMCDMLVEFTVRVRLYLYRSKPAKYVAGREASTVDNRKYPDFAKSGKGFEFEKQETIDYLLLPLFVYKILLRF